MYIHQSSWLKTCAVTFTGAMQYNQNKYNYYESFPTSGPVGENAGGIH